MFDNKYSISVDDDNMIDYLSILSDNEINMFLANDININTNTVSVDSSSASSLNSHGGFITSGKLITSRSNDLQLQIKFIQTNYSIIELLFDRWIAALAAQGLIQDSSLPELRADIIMYQYAAGHPTHSKKTPGAWTLRKKVTVYKAFPVSKGPIKSSYEPSTAGQLKEDIIQFKYSDYRIDYIL